MGSVGSRMWCGIQDVQCGIQDVPCGIQDTRGTSLPFISPGSGRKREDREEVHTSRKSFMAVSSITRSVRKVPR